METPLQAIDRIIKELTALKSKVFEFKECSNPKCKRPYKPLSKFYEVAKAVDGLSSWCKDCQRRSAAKSFKKRKGMEG